MPLFFKILLLLTIVSLQKAGAQSLVTLSPISNCPKGVFVDYMAALKPNVDKKSIQLTGKVFSSNDTIKKVKIKIASLKNNLGEILFSGNMTIDKVKSKFDIKTEAFFPQGTIINNKDFFLELLFQKEKTDLSDFEINYQFEFANSCVFVLRQKIIQITDH